MTISRMLQMAAGAGGIGLDDFYTYPIPNSVYFEEAENTSYLTLNDASIGDRRAFTFATWVKIHQKFDPASSTRIPLFSVDNGTSALQKMELYFLESGELRFDQDATTTSELTSGTEPLFRDNASWYHIVLSVNTNANIVSERIIIWVNGTEYQYLTNGSITQYSDIGIGSDAQHYIGYSVYDNVGASMSLAETHYVDGTALEASDFGEYKYGIWVPKLTNITDYGDKGVYLKYTNASDLGSATKGNGWTATNIAGHQSKDSPTQNYPTVHPGYGVYPATYTVTKGGTRVNETSVNGDYGAGFASVGVESGKWYWEVTPTGAAAMGFCSETVDKSLNDFRNEYGSVYVTKAGSVVDAGSSAGVSFTAVSDGTPIGLALDVDNSTLKVYLGSTLECTYDFSARTDLINERLIPFITSNNVVGTNPESEFNFGQQPFAYPIPSGYKTLVNTNLIDEVDHSAGNLLTDSLKPYTYTGTGSNATYNNVGFTPDWIVSVPLEYEAFPKIVEVDYSAQLYHQMGDESDNGTNMEVFNPASGGFNTNLSSSPNDNFNGSGLDYLNLLWDDTAANGFRIWAYSGTNNYHAVYHGHSKAPSFMYIHNQTNTSGVEKWWFWFKEFDDISGGKWLMDSGIRSGGLTDVDGYGVVNMDDEKFYVTSGDTYLNDASSIYRVMSVHNVEGSTRAGSFVHNGSSSDGPYVNLGFMPSLIWFIRETGGEQSLNRAHQSSNGNPPALLNPVSTDYNMLDYGGSSGYNNTSTGLQADFLSNGFKIRRSSWSDGDVIYYVAFAEHPAKYSTAV